MGATLIYGLQFGDEAKGKFVDYEASSGNYDYGARFGGGANAGHTVVTEGEPFIFHLIPSGLISKLPCTMGNGMYIHPLMLLEEIDALEKYTNRKITPRDLYISHAAHIVRPVNIAEDLVEGGVIGTTAKGIGPCASDKYKRIGIRMQHLLPENRNVLEKRFENDRKRLEELNRILEEKGILESQKMEPFDTNELLEQYIEAGEKLEPYIQDTWTLINGWLRADKKILVEGAQGHYLDIDFGTFPFVTSSHSTPCGICQGLGISPKWVERIIGVVKAYTTRVGGGPLPGKYTGERENKIREEGNEFGATTGRPRDVAPLHLGMVKEAVLIGNPDELALSKLDVLGGETLRIILGHRKKNGEIVDFDPEIEDLVYSKAFEIEKFDGHVPADFEEMPPGAKGYTLYIPRQIGVPISMIGVGPKRHQTVTKGVLEATKAVLKG